jgi:DNA-binding MarR family transcriptional regulator
MSSVKADAALAKSEIADAIVRIVPSLNRWAESVALGNANGADLSLRQVTALAMIKDEQPTLGELARRLRVTPAVVTGLVDRLERRGYVTRAGSSEDRRRIHLILTDDGKKMAATVQQRIADDFSAALDGLDSETLVDMAQALQEVERITNGLGRNR